MGEMIWGGSTTSNERGLAMVAHIAALVLPVVGPILIYFIKKDDSKFVAYHAVQAAAFQVISYLIAGATCGFGLVLLILPIVWAVKAYNGEWTGYPLIDSAGRN
ncbi:MAG: putative Tic20 family protein [Myxococcota bacterium]|jgi:uncharacterized Tic20 family protein